MGDVTPSGTHVCGHLNGRRRIDGGFLARCAILVADDTGFRYCFQHRDGWRERWAWRGSAAHPHNPAGRGAAEAGLAAVAGGQVIELPAPRRAAPVPSAKETAARDRLDVAVREARSIAGRDWQRQADKRVRLALGPSLYWQVRRADSFCADLAEVANCLTRLDREGDRALERALAPRTLELLVNPGLTKLVVRNFAAQTVPAPVTSMATLVRALRAFGVLLCALENGGGPNGAGRIGSGLNGAALNGGGAGDLARCRCLWPLARHAHESKIRNEVRMVVAYGLDRIPAEWLVLETSR